jgi:hypothetical protein
VAKAHHVKKTQLTSNCLLLQMLYGRECVGIILAQKIFMITPMKKNNNSRMLRTVEKQRALVHEYDHLAGKGGEGYLPGLVSKA